MKFNGRRPIPASVMPVQANGSQRAISVPPALCARAHLNTSASFKLARSCLRQTRHLPAVFSSYFSIAWTKLILMQRPEDGLSDDRSPCNREPYCGNNRAQVQSRPGSIFRIRPSRHVSRAGALVASVHGLAMRIASSARRMSPRGC